MPPSSHAAHPLLRSRAIVAMIAFLALAFTGISVSQAHAAENPPAGTYTGESTAFTGATVSFDVDANGNMSNFSSQSYCSDGFSVNVVDWVGMPSTPVEVGVPFELEWTYDTGDISPYYELTGTINADGTASGTGRAGFLPYGTCGGMNFTWSASTEVGGGDPDPVYDPTASVSPSELTESELADGGVTIEGQDFAPNTDVDLAINGSIVETEASLYNGNVIFEYSSDSLGAGSHTAVLTSGDLSASTSFTVTADTPVYDPQVSVSPNTLTVSEAQADGVDITVTGFPADTEISVGVVENQLGQVVQTDSDGNAFLESYGLGGVSPGEYTVSASYEDLNAQAIVTITADAPVYDPQLSVSPSLLTLSEALEDGVEVSVTGFPANTEISLGVVETQSGQVIETDANGSVLIQSYIVGGIGVGDYTYIATYEDLSAQAVVTVIEDDDPVYDPQVSVSPSTLTESELAESGVTVSVSGFPENVSVDVTLGGSQGESVTTGADGSATLSNYTTSALGVGTHSVEAGYEDLSASTSFTVEADPIVYDPQVSVSPTTLPLSEALDNGVDVSVTGFPANTVISVDVVETQSGQVIETDADGNVFIESYALGSVVVGDYTLIASYEDLSAQAVVTVTEDPIVYNPEVSVAPSSLTVSELAHSGVTISGSDFPADASVSLTVAGVVAGSQSADANGDVEFEFTSDSLDAGSQAVVLTSGDLSASASFTVEADPAPVYDPEISLSTTEVTETALADEGVDVSGTGFPANATVTLFVADQEVTSGDSDADGAIAFTFWGENLELGEYTVRLVADAEGADVQATFTVIADEQDDDPAPETIPAAEPSPEDLDAELQGEVVVPSGAAPGDRIVLTVTGVDPGTQVGVWIFSDPAYLGTHTVDGNGQVTVILPAGLAEGTHSISVWTDAGLVGWDTIVVSADGDPGVTDPEDGTGGAEDELALTGGTVAAGTLVGGVLLLVIGFGLVVLARTRRSVTA